jgi:hypothetical protein
MTRTKFPAIDEKTIASTRDALHAYAQILGHCLKASRPKRKHWWHASLRPSLTGLATGIIRADIDFELTLDLHSNLLRARTASGDAYDESLKGQPVYQLADTVIDFLISTGAKRSLAADLQLDRDTVSHFEGYSEEQAKLIGRVFGDVAAAMAKFRAEIVEESSPIQLWPHHFDMSLLWLPGEKIPGQDPSNEEYSDKQMNFGFALGDEAIAEPYFYVTAYPLPEQFAEIKLPPGVRWESTAFSGALLTYETLLQNSDPEALLLDWWRLMLRAGKEFMLEQEVGGESK